jgi:branched-chain amino acid transport system ATP-binding protein
MSSPSPAPLLQTKNVTKRFGELVAVHKVNLTVERGEFVTIIGPNGAGKTTLFDLITRRQNPSEGEVCFQGIDVTKLPPQELVKLGVVRSFQLVSIFPELTVFQNVALGVQKQLVKKGWYTSRVELNEEVTRRTEEILHEVLDLTRHKKRLAGALPHGYKKYLEIGIALSAEPQLLLLDEPLSGVSTTEALDLMKFVKSLRKDFTIIVIEHKIELIRAFVERLVVMNQGEILADGTYSELMANKAVIEAYLGVREEESEP